MSGYETQPTPALDVPFEVEMVGDEVVFIGPGPVAFAMTWAAARETAARLCALLAAAEELGSTGDSVRHSDWPA